MTDDEPTPANLNLWRTVYHTEDTCPACLNQTIATNGRVKWCFTCDWTDTKKETDEPE